MGRGKPLIGAQKKLTIKAVSNQDKKELKKLADDFGLLRRKEVQEIIENCKSYTDGQQKIMRVYTAVYMR